MSFLVKPDVAAEASSIFKTGLNTFATNRNAITQRMIVSDKGSLF